MSATEHGTGGLPDNAPIVTKQWVLGQGETEIQEWPLGTPTAAFDAYEAAKSNDNVSSVDYTNRTGRASVRIAYGVAGAEPTEWGEDVRVIEEVYAVDEIKDASESPYFYAVDHDDVAWVRKCADEQWTEDEIDAA
ncbi:MAG: hypothetical protein ABIH03_00730, partial [Pseudomonadota bacterium]